MSGIFLSPLEVFRRIRSRGIAISLLASPIPSHAAVYTVIAPPGSVSTVAASINSKGKIAGYYSTKDGGSAGLVRSADGTYTAFLQNHNPVVVAINDNGWVAGETWSDPHEKAFIRKPNGDISQFSAGRRTNFILVSGINNRAEVCGWFEDNSGHHGFVRAADGTFRKFDALGSILTQVNGINDSGTVAGSVVIGGSAHGFMRADDGTTTEIDFAGSISSSANSINALGAIAGGYATNPLGGDHGFVRDPSGVFTSFDVGTGNQDEQDIVVETINTKGMIAGTYEYGDAPPLSDDDFLRKPGGRIVRVGPPVAMQFDPVFALWINRKDAIVGFYRDADGNSHGYLLTP